MKAKGGEKAQDTTTKTDDNETHMQSHNKRKDNNAKNHETWNESQGGKKAKSIQKNNKNVDVLELWLSGRKTVENSNESDKDDEGYVHRSVPNVMETGAMMRIASITEKSRIVTQDSDNGSDDMESNEWKKKDRKKKKKNKNLE